jgi:3-oxoacyl-[acyl-carrier protein] reductase
MTSPTTWTASSMNNSFLLEGKHAVVFGAAGSIGAAVAKEFAAEGAKVSLAGRTKSKVKQVASQIVAADGRLDERQSGYGGNAAEPRRCGALRCQAGGAKPRRVCRHRLGDLVKCPLTPVAASQFSMVPNDSVTWPGSGFPLWMPPPKSGVSL